MRGHTSQYRRQVAALAAAWIEIPYTQLITLLTSVAALAAAWIEIFIALAK